MARPIVIVAVTGITVSIACLWLASLLSPGHGFSFVLPAQSPWPGSGETVTRDLPWTGSDRLEIATSGVVHFQRGPAWRATATGPQSIVDRLRIDGGRLYVDSPGDNGGDSSLEVQLSGPALQRVGLNGSGELILEDLQQDSLSIDIRGSGEVRATGAVRSLELRLLGSADANLGELETVDLEASILGSGDAEVSPTGDADVRILGSGDLQLLTRPRHLSSRVQGSGEVIEAEPPAGET